MPMPISARNERRPVGSSSDNNTSWQPAATPSTEAVPSAWSCTTCESSWPSSMANCSSVWMTPSLRSMHWMSSSGTHLSAPSQKRTAMPSSSSPTTSAMTNCPPSGTATLAPAARIDELVAPEAGERLSVQNSPRCMKMRRGTSACTKALGVFTSTTRNPSSCQASSWTFARSSLSMRFRSAESGPVWAVLSSSSWIKLPTVSRAARSTRGNTDFTEATSLESSGRSLTCPSASRAPMLRNTCSAWRLRVPSGSAA
mmetsp:Transcript_84307/g.251254  ORF Transcript_84307/g.251254 Transcript_84307/m.251254 type:complete len:256 (-) Transcript_84307:108-875(-)